MTFFTLDVWVLFSFLLVYFWTDPPAELFTRVMCYDLLVDPVTRRFTSTIIAQTGTQEMVGFRLSLFFFRTGLILS